MKRNSLDSKIKGGGHWFLFMVVVVAILAMVFLTQVRKDESAKNTFRRLKETRRLLAPPKRTILEPPTKEKEESIYDRWPHNQYFNNNLDRTGKH